MTTGAKNIVIPGTSEINLSPIGFFLDTPRSFIVLLNHINQEMDFPQFDIICIVTRWNYYLRHIY